MWALELLHSLHSAVRVLQDNRLPRPNTLLCFTSLFPNYPLSLPKPLFLSSCPPSHSQQQGPACSRAANNHWAAFPNMKRSSSHSAQFLEDVLKWDQLMAEIMTQLRDIDCFVLSEKHEAHIDPVALPCHSDTWIDCHLQQPQYKSENLVSVAKKGLTDNMLLITDGNENH